MSGPPDTLTAAQAQLVERSRRLALETFPTLRARLGDDGPALRAAVVDASREAGLFPMTQPRAHGGTEAPTVELTLAREILAASGDPLRRHVFGPGPGVLAGAGGELAERFLGPLLRGERSSAFAFTEPAGAAPTTATPDGDAWRLDGHKSYVTGGAEADFFAVVARIEDAGEASGSILLVVDGDAPGLARSAPFESMDGSAHLALTFEGVRVPAAQVVGAPGEGLPRALRQIGDVRVLIAAEACGLMQCALEHLEAHLRAPHRTGGTLGDREGVRLRFAGARIDAMAARSLLYRTAALVDAGENTINEGIATKVFTTEAAGRVVDTALQLEGGQALVRGHLLERLYREVRALRFTEGATDVLQLNLARGRLELDKGRL